MNKNTLKKLGLVVLFMVLILTLSGCAKIDYSEMKPPTDFFYGTIYKLFGHPLQNVMLWTAEKMGGANGAGWAIAGVSFVVRLILLPLMLNQSFKSTRQTEKMKALQPQLALVQEAMKTPNLTQEQTLKINALSMAVYKENNMSMMGGMGCLPLLLQLPIMFGIYQAVVYSKSLFSSSFYGIALGNPSMFITIMATLLYLVQGYMTMSGVPAEQKKMMQMTLIMSPLMTFFISVSAPAALALYFLVGGIIIIIQQVIVSYIIMPKVKRDVDKELAETPMKTVVSKEIIAEILNSDNSSSETTPTNYAGTVENASSNEIHNKNRSRNAGKQQRHRDDK